MYRCLDIVIGRGACLKFARRTRLLTFRLCSLRIWVWCRCSGLLGGGFAGGCSFVESLWLICLLLGECSRSLGGLVDVWSIVVVLVSGLMLSSVGGFAWVIHAVAFLRNSISVSVSAG